MIDNVILLITGTLHERDTHELLERCHPLGMFDSIAALCVATTVADLYNTVMIETPIGKTQNGTKSFPCVSRTYHPFLSAIFWKMPQCTGSGWNEYWNYSKCTVQVVHWRFLCVLFELGRGYGWNHGWNPSGSRRMTPWGKSNINNRPIFFLVWSWSTGHQHHHQFLQYRIDKGW